MNTKRNMSLTRTALFVINFTVIVFFSAIIYKTTDLICFSDQARDFLEKIKYVPITPWKVPLFTVSLLIILILGIFIREKYFLKKPLVLYLFCVADVIICIAIMYYLNLGYKGILFIAFTNIIIYVGGKKNKLFFLLGAIIIYMFFDYDIFSIKINMFSANDYIQYYTTSQRLYLFGFRNILTSLNEVVFILFMIFTIQNEIDENTKIKELYSRLFKNAEELKVVNIQLEDYAKKSEDMAKTRERNRLAREIHDTIGHALTGIATGLEACTELIDNDVSQTKIQLKKITELARKGLIDVRRSVSELRPDSLERFSLIPAINKLAEDINACTKTKVSVFIEGEPLKMGADEEETIYRVVQESITNSVRHGNANEIKIHLKFNDFMTYLTISDDGVGSTDLHKGFGLRHIKERVELLNGEVNFESEAGKGFITNVELPIRWG